MRKIDLNFFWADEFNNLFPLYISPFGNINIKLAFLHKNAVKMVQDVQDKSLDYDVVGSGIYYNY